MQYWSFSRDNLFKQLETGPEGLDDVVAKKRRKRLGPNNVKVTNNNRLLILLFRQFTTPLVLLLLLCAILSAFLQDRTTALIIILIVIVSGLLGFFQERSAFTAMQKLMAMVQIKATVLRSQIVKELPTELLVPGDVILLKAGDIIPADCLLLEAKDLFVDEATLTGETMASEKKPGILPPETPLKERTSMLYMASHVVSGTGKAVVVATGSETQFGTIAQSVQKTQTPNAFEIGVRHFGLFLMNVTLVLVGSIFAFNLYFHRPILESFLFSLALAIGLTPQLLPAIVTINMARGARYMAKKKVIVKKLSAIENFGSMEVLCCDKTGTLTKGVVELYAALDKEGKPSEEVELMAFLNAHFQMGYANQIDNAILTHKNFDITRYEKLDEIPYDFERKRLSILVRHGSDNILITKGAFHQIQDICQRDPAPLIEQEFQNWGAKGFRTLGIAYKKISSETITKEQEEGMTFLGFLHFYDPPKKEVKETLQEMRALGIALKMITGDNVLVTRYVADAVGLESSIIATGPELDLMSDEALGALVSKASLFAEIEPRQKLRLIEALKLQGKTVGFIGDGINDIMALHAADVSLSVEGAIDVAQEVAEIVLLKKELSILTQGVVEGRKIFANTMKYIFMATSANFGNMFSMAGASVIMNFLPMLPTQILLTNFLTDIPEMTIASDKVDPEMTSVPCRWDMKFIYHFMLVFGLISSLFDYITFAGLIYVLKASEAQFRTGWLIESVLSAAFIVLFIRTRRPVYKSRPSLTLQIATFGVMIFAACLPYTPLAALFKLVPLPLPFYGFIAAILIGYLVLVEIAKKIFYKRAFCTAKAHL